MCLCGPLRYGGVDEKFYIPGYCTLPYFGCELREKGGWQLPVNIFSASRSDKRRRASSRAGGSQRKLNFN